MCASAPACVAGAEVVQNGGSSGQAGRQEPDAELAPLGPAAARLHLGVRAADPPAALASAVGAGAAGDGDEVDAVPVGVQVPVAGLEDGGGRSDRDGHGNRDQHGGSGAHGQGRPKGWTVKRVPCPELVGVAVRKPGSACARDTSSALIQSVERWTSTRSALKSARCTGRGAAP